MKTTYLAFCLVPRPDNEPLDDTEIKYLEYKSIQDAKQNNNYRLDENRQTPKKPIINEAKRSEIDAFYKDVKLLTTFIGCYIFEKKKKENEQKIYYLKNSKVDAKGYYKNGSMTVLKGSIIASTHTNSFKEKENRNKIIAEKTKKDEDKIILTENIIFNSPSSAAAFCIGNNANGWIYWKDKNNKTLDELIRKQK